MREAIMGMVFFCMTLMVLGSPSISGEIEGLSLIWSTRKGN